MTAIIYITVAFLIAWLLSAAKTHRAVAMVAAVFYAMQAAAAAAVIFCLAGQSSAMFFTFDRLGTLFFTLLAIVSPVAFCHAQYYISAGSIHDVRLFNQLLILLCTAISGVYFASNIAVTWICLEATTLCAAGVIYHRRRDESLEATWKYIFVCSTGITMAYLGILLLCGTAAGEGLSYEGLRIAVRDGNPLYLKIAFLLVLAGFSCKLEVFPLYPIGVDANYATPAPAAALISTVLVNAGFVSVFRIYEVIAASPVFEWAGNVMILTGVISLMFGAIFIRRATHLKRFLSYSTVENMGIVLIGLGIGGAGVAAAVLHAAAHTFVKSGMFLLAAQAGKTYDSYHINSMTDFMKINPTAATAMLVGALMLMAFPPSLLFVSELGVLGQMAAQGRWWLLGTVALLLCIAVYGICNTVFKICYQHPEHPHRTFDTPKAAYTWSAMALIAIAMILGAYRPQFFMEIIETIANF